MKKMIHEGSVKDVYRENEGELVFHYSDRYSIYDWGQMPNEIPGKGVAIAEMGAIFFEELSKKGIKNHFLRRGKEDRRDLIVREVDVPRGKMHVYQQKPVMTLIPIEFIFRFGVPKGSSLLRKHTSEIQWIQAGFDRQYAEGEFFDDVIMDYTTKLEAIDRDLKKEAVVQIGGLNDKEVAVIAGMVRKIAHHLRDRFKALGLVLWDGKLEFAFDENREIMLVDSIGLDEMRVTFEDRPLSKEVLRQFYVNTPWFNALSIAKKEAPTMFRQYCERVLKQEPQKLPPQTIESIGNLYALGTKILSASKPEEIKKIHEEIRSTYRSLGVNP